MTKSEAGAGAATIFVLTGLGMWGNLGGEVEDCCLEIAARAGP